jgi:integrase
MAERKRSRRGSGTGSLYRRPGSKIWLMRWTDHDGKRRERTTRTTDKQGAERILNRTVAESALRKAGVIDARAESVSKEGQRPITEHAEEYERWLRSKGNTEKHVKHAVRCLKRMVKAMKADALTDLAPSKVLDQVQKRRDAGASPRTCNFDMRAIKGLTRWAHRDGRLSVDPLVGLQMLNEAVDRRRDRRPLEPDELALLLDITERGDAYRGLSGPDRVMIYRLAVGTGFRAGELASLTRADFDLDADPPAVTVKAAYSKRRRDDRQPIRRDLVDLLRPWLARKPYKRPVLNMPDKTAKMLRGDLRHARAVWITETPIRPERHRRYRSNILRDTDSEGRVVDFHALRATFITMLVKGGATVKEAQSLARHSTPTLTLNTYTKLGVHDLAGALDRLPTIPNPGDQSGRGALRATGTDDATAESVLTSNPDKQGAEQFPPMHDHSADDPPEPIPFSRASDCDDVSKSNAAHDGAASCSNALYRTRTYDPLIKSQLLCQLS